MPAYFSLFVGIFCLILGVIMMHRKTHVSWVLIEFSLAIINFMIFFMAKS